MVWEQNLLRSWSPFQQLRFMQNWADSEAEGIFQWFQRLYEISSISAELSTYRYCDDQLRPIIDQHLSCTCCWRRISQGKSYPESIFILQKYHSSVAWFLLLGLPIDPTLSEAPEILEQEEALLLFPLFSWQISLELGCTFTVFLSFDLLVSSCKLPCAKQEPLLKLMNKVHEVCLAKDERKKMNHWRYSSYHEIFWRLTKICRYRVSFIKNDNE